MPITLLCRQQTQLCHGRAAQDLDNGYLGADLVRDPEHELDSDERVNAGVLSCEAAESACSEADAASAIALVSLSKSFSV
ncbi:hypothetical protein DL766_005135 [Monosporascus sp. MC13-8B]|uniref:Uncharacterized protein n=1 Tax=Monosporascus cannonballus TaxID=155416 RepID=A0ABY0HBS7_9PEZI|nr:hypothetical protein DL762_003003 [Monosporascus cannonballus]RYO96097.1 hypothetical protein DL763_003387 [Monosporascus cannonballus]RYP29936.1 hypothetical protein DL766_005135 [Monosporascus sp. MC13-8B]